MIVLDKHIWIWWVHDDSRLKESQRRALSANDRIGVSAISCWEVAKLTELGRLGLPLPVETWFSQALAYPGVELLDLNPEVAVASTRLGGEHKDTADQIIVAKALTHNCPLVTSDRKLTRYTNVETIT
ncbi:MAG: PIN domain nuclease [Gemmatimonadetes bacterium]|nr:PIN domain nuclease [Gemmatimonadota bacterium]